MLEPNADLPTPHHESPAAAPRPTAALLLHNVERPRDIPAWGQPSAGGGFVTHHAVHDTAEGPVLGPGAVMTADHVESVIDELRGTTSRRRQGVSLLPAQVVAAGADVLAWIVPGAVRPMWIRAGERRERLEVPWPHLLFVARERGVMGCWALRSKARPSAATPLYHAPLMNIGHNGAVCLGGVKPPDGVGFDDIPAWNAVMFETLFSHVNHSETFRPMRGERAFDTAAHVRRWRSLRRCRRFPIRWLNPTGRTVGDLMEWL